jgi:hypothetical protein
MELPGTWVEAAVDDIASHGAWAMAPTGVHDDHYNPAICCVSQSGSAPPSPLLTPEKGKLKYVLTNSIGASY